MPQSSRAHILAGLYSVEYYFFKGAQVGGQTWDLLDFRIFSLTIAAP